MRGKVDVTVVYEVHHTFKDIPIDEAISEVRSWARRDEAPFEYVRGNSTEYMRVLDVLVDGEEINKEEWQ